MKKKALSLALALVMCLGLTAPAFAAEDAWSCIAAKTSTDPVELGQNIEVLLEDIFSGYVSNETKENIGVIPGGTTFTITNDGGAYDIYIYLQTCRKLEPNETVSSFDPETGEDCLIKDTAGKYYGSSAVEYLAAELPYNEDSATPAGNGMYWLVDTYADPYSMGINLLKSGESVSFKLPEDGMDILYSLYVEYYNENEDRNYWKTLNFFVDTQTANSLSQSQQPADPEPTTPTVTVEDIPASGTAKVNEQNIEIDGKAVKFQTYMLLDANGNGTNYVKLRDIAHVLNGTKAQFSVDYDGSISLTTGAAYKDNGSEMSTPFSGDRAYTGGAQSIKVNGTAVDMTAITLLDDAGGGYNYFKLRDLGKALGFNVGWSKDRGVFVESGKPYAE